MLSFSWWDIARKDNVKSKLKQRCLCQPWNLQRRTTSNQLCVFQRWHEQRYTMTKQTSLSKSSFTALVNVEKRCENNYFQKEQQQQQQKEKKHSKFNTLNSKF